MLEPRSGRSPRPFPLPRLLPLFVSGFLPLQLGFLLLALLSPACATMGGDTTPTADPTTEGAIAFVNVRVFDGERLLEGQTVIVDGDRIAAVGPAGELTPTPDALVLEGADYTLLPGFIDLHVHLEFYPPQQVLKGGITTARDLAWPPDRIFPLAESLAAGYDRGPRLLAAGPMLTAPGGYPIYAGWAPDGTGLEVETPDQGRAAVRDLAARGAAVIKVAQAGSPSLPLEVLRAIVEEAHTAGLKVTSHVNSLAQLELALEAGIDELAHGLWSDEALPESALQRMVDQGMVVVPTLHIDGSEARLDNLRRFLEAGGTVLYGTDMGNFGPPPGIDPTELNYMVQAGMTTRQALAAGTSAAAAYLGLEDRGRVAPGQAADLVLVDGDPEADFSVLSRPVAVLREGVLVK